MSLVAVFLSVALQAAPQESRLPVADLIGLSPAEIGALIGATPDIDPDDALRIADSGRTLDLYPVRRFWRQPINAREGCLTGFEYGPVEGDSPERRRALAGRSTGLLVFENGRLTGVYPEPRRAPAADRPASRRTMEAMVRAPRPPSSLTVAPGRLPLSDGAAVIERLEPAQDGAVLVALCRQIPEQTYRSDPGMDFIWGLVGLTVLPAVPFRNAEDARAEREGGALLASVEPGADLSAPAEDWAGRIRGVRVYRDAIDSDYAVIAVKLGAGDDTAAKVGLLGVRGRRVLWKAERDAADQSGLRALICRDQENRATDARRGCSSTGFLIP